MLTIYLALAAWFALVDILAAHINGIPARPVAASLLALLWPASLAFALLASALIIRRLRDRLEAAGIEA
ncbi:MAG TPA: hypothetical protein VIG97_14445 [Luteimonas sp.]